MDNMDMGHGQHFLQIFHFRNGKTKYNNIEYEDDMDICMTMDTNSQRQHAPGDKNRSFFLFQPRKSAGISGGKGSPSVSLIGSQNQSRPVLTSSVCVPMLRSCLSGLTSSEACVAAFSRPVSEMDAARELLCRCTKSSDWLIVTNSGKSSRSSSLKGVEEEVGSCIAWTQKDPLGSCIGAKWLPHATWHRVLSTRHA